MAVCTLGPLTEKQNKTVTILSYCITRKSTLMHRNMNKALKKIRIYIYNLKPAYFQLF